MNCLGYALGIDDINKTREVVSSSIGCKPEKPQPTSCFLEKCTQLGFQVREVFENEVISDSETRIAFWGFFPIIADSLFRDSEDDGTVVYTWAYNFHVARQEKNGLWTHKWGWNTPPESTSLHLLCREYGVDPIFFAVTQKKQE